MSRTSAVSIFPIRSAAILIIAQICGAALGQTASAPAEPADGELFRATLKPFTASAETVIRVSEFSGLPVPRYASLRTGEINGRSGPGFEYPVSWTYERVGLPVIIVRESKEWRKVRDPQGDEVWVKTSFLSGERTVMATASGDILDKDDPRARPLVRFSAGAVMQLKGCEGQWCRVESGEYKGHVLKALLWGAGDLAGQAG